MLCVLSSEINARCKQNSYSIILTYGEAAFVMNILHNAYIDIINVFQDTSHVYKLLIIYSTYMIYKSVEVVYPVFLPESLMLGNLAWTFLSISFGR